MSSADLAPFATEYTRAPVEPTISGLARAIAETPQMSAGIAATWGLLAIGATLAWLASRRSPSAKAAVPRPDRRMLLAVVLAGVVVRVARLNLFDSWAEDEGFYAHALLTALEHGRPTGLHWMTGSLFAWPPIAFALSQLARAVGVDGWIVTRLVTSVLCCLCAWVVGLITERLVNRWSEPTSTSSRALELAPALAALTVVASTGPLYDSLYATYDPMALLLFLLGLYHLLRGTLGDVRLSLWAAASLLTASFVTRHFPIMAHAPIILLVALAAARTARRLRAVLLHFVLPWSTLTLGYLTWRWQDVADSVHHARWLAGESVLRAHHTIADLTHEIGAELGLPLAFVLLGAIILWREKRPGTDTRWDAALGMVAWGTVAAYNLQAGHTFSLEKNLALSVCLGAPLAGLGLARLLGRSRAGTIGTVLGVLVFGVLTLVPALDKVSERLPRVAGTRALRDWFLANVTLPSTPTYWTSFGTESNPWSIKLELANRNGNGLRVPTGPAFGDPAAPYQEELPSDFFHFAIEREESARAGLGEDTPPVQMAMIAQSRQYRIYAIPSEHPAFVNWVLVRAEIDVRAGAPCLAYAPR